MIFEAPQIFTARIDVLIDGTSVNGFPVDIDIFNESLDFSPVFWESDVDVSLSGKKRSNIRGYDLLLRLDYEHTLEPDKFDAIYEQLPNAIRYDTEIRLYPDATDTERYYAVVPTSSTVQSVMYESTVKGADKPTLEFENVELLDSVASYGSPSSAGGDADTLNGFTADDFLKSDANDTYESGNTLTFNGDVNLQGVVSVGNLGGTPFSIGGVRLFENGDEQKLGVNESPQFAGLAIGNAIGDPFTVGGIRIFDAGDEQELGTSASPTFGGATFNGNFTAPNYNPNAWDDASDRAPTALSVNLSGILTLTRFNTTNLQADLQAWADTRYTQSSQIDSNWDTAYDRSVTDFRLVTNSLEIVRENATTLDVNLGTWGAGLYFQKALNLSEGDPATMRNNLGLGDVPNWHPFMSASTSKATDWDDYKDAGTDYGLSNSSNAANSPDGSQYYHPVVFEYNGTNNSTQLAIPYGNLNPANKFYMRGHYNGTWTAWEAFRSQSFNDDRYAQLTGATFTGAINGTSATFTGAINGTSATFTGFVQTDTFYDERTNLGHVGSLSRNEARAFFNQPATPENWRDIPMGTAFFVYNNDIDDTGNTNGGAPTQRGYFLKISNKDSGVGWSGLWMPYSGEQDNFYVGISTQGTSFADWFKVALHNTSPTFSGGTLTGALSGTSADFSGNIDANAFRINGTTVISSSRNASFAGGTFTGNVTFSSFVNIFRNSTNLLRLRNTLLTANQRQFDVRIEEQSGNGVLRIRSVEDGSITQALIMTILRNGNVGIGQSNPSAFKFDVTGTGRFTGDVDILGNDGLDVRRGLTGGYNDTTDSGSNWGANIWGIGDAYTSSGHGSGFSLGNHYGLAWLRPAHPDRVGSSEGLYVYQVGNLLAHFGSERAYIREPLGIGVLSPSEQLDVNGNVQADDFILT